MSKKWEKQYAEDEWYRHLYRTGNAYHGVHPFYAWYWGAHGLQHAGKVIIVGGDPPTVRRLGFTPASTMDDAFEIASDVVGRDADHQPSPRPRAPGGRRAMSEAHGAVFAHRVAPRDSPRRRRQRDVAARPRAEPQRRLPVPQAQHPQGCRGAAGPIEARRQLRDRVGPSRARKGGTQGHHQRTAATGRARAGQTRDLWRRPARRPAPPRGSTAADLRPDPPQPSRHAAVDHLHSRAVAIEACRRCCSRLLLRRPLEGHHRRAVAERDSRSIARSPAARRAIS